MRLSLFAATIDTMHVADARPATWKVAGGQVSSMSAGIGVV